MFEQILITVSSLLKEKNNIGSNQIRADEFVYLTFHISSRVYPTFNQKVSNLTNYVAI